MKDLIGLDAWAGEIVHRMIQDILQRWRVQRPFTEEECVERAVRLLSRQYRDSQAFRSAHPDEFPSRPALLDLHYYGEAGPSKERAAGIKERVSRSLRNFLRSGLAARIRQAGPSCWLPIDRNASARLVDDLLILVKPDFAFTHEGKLLILDWKTGRPDPFWEVVQVTCYALYAAEKWKRPLHEIVPQIVHLYPEFQLSVTDYCEETLGEVKLFIQESQAAILSLYDPDTLPPIDRFSVAEDPRSCQWCQFRGLCDGASR